MSDSRTQSVCKHCQHPIYYSRLVEKWSHFVADSSHVAEPVAEPASTGEQPPKIDKWINSAAMEIRSWVWRTTSKWVSPSAIEELIQVSYMCEAALPSEPSAPPVELPGPTGEGSSGHSWIEPAPQTSAAPQLCQECGDPEGAILHILEPDDSVGHKFKPAAPQPVSDPAPSPTPSVSTEPPSLISRLRYIGGKLRTDLNDSAMLYPRNWNLEAVQQLISEWDEVATEAVKFEMQPSVAGTQPTVHIVSRATDEERKQDCCGDRYTCNVALRCSCGKLLCDSDMKEHLLNVALAASDPGAAQGTPQVEEVASELLDAMETCHICHSYLILQEFPVHCADCSSDCENHDGDECTPIYVLHERLRKALQKRKHGVGAPAQPGPQEKR